MNEYLKCTTTFNFDHSSVEEFGEEFEKLRHEPLELVVGIYNKVRDNILYNPFDIKIDPDYMKASLTAQKGFGHCIDKSSLFIALCRRFGIPARLGLSKVKNHIGTARFETIIKSDVLVPHGYAEVKIDGTWVKCTPVFNKTLCEKLSVPPLNFNGVDDSMFQSYNEDGKQFMEYLEDYGSFDEPPLKLIIRLLREHYPHLFDGERFKRELLMPSE
ncbi:MAG: transglutaminase family protein [Bacteroidota bacterium]